MYGPKDIAGKIGLAKRRWGSYTIVFHLLLALLVIPLLSFEEEDDENAFDEIYLTLNVQRIGSVEIPAIIQQQNAYLPVKEVFDYLRIKNTLSADADSLTGFFINPKATFVIDKRNNEITYLDKKFHLKPEDLVSTESNLYLKSDHFGEVFGLDCSFNFRTLSVNLVTKIELPAIREMQQEQMRRNISHLKGEKKADTTIGRTFKFFQAGMADWSVNSTQQKGAKPFTYANVSLGAMVAGGEATVDLNFNSAVPFTHRTQLYKWRYVDNESHVLKQITAGKTYMPSTASLFAPVTGITVSNAPTTYRKSFGTYRLSRTTQPGWTVELFVNNVLVNYTKADASGFFSFEVPIVYGQSNIKLRFYGPWGEEETKEEYINIPFNFLPVNQFEYSFSGGVVNDDSSSRFSRANFGYGLTDRISVGGGLEYLSSVTSGPTMPYINTSIRLGSAILVSAEKAFGVRTKGTINYRHPYNLSIEINYSKYDKGQTAIRYNYIEEKKATISVPVRTKSFAAFSRLSYSSYTLPKSKYTTAEWMVSSVVKGVSVNVANSYLQTTSSAADVFSNLSLTFRLPKNIRLTTQGQYAYTRQNLDMVKGEVEKPFMRNGYVNFSFDNDFRYHTQNYSLGVRYNFSFAQASTYTRKSNHGVGYSQSMRGSILYAQEDKKLAFTNQNNVGRGALIIAPFLDLNCNGTWDSNEPKVAGLFIRSSGGRVIRNDDDSTIKVTGLEAYNNYWIECDKNNFDNVAWQIKKPVISVMAEANYFKTIQVPVSVVGEVAGYVMMQEETETKGIGRMIVNIFNKENKVVATVLSETDGYFNYIGLAPGKYRAEVDRTQLQKLKINAVNKQSFEIKMNAEGDVVDNVKLVLKKKAE